MKKKKITPNQDFITRKARKKIHPARGRTGGRKTWRARYIYLGGALFALCSMLFALWLFGLRSTIREDVSYQVRAGAVVSAVAGDLEDGGLIPDESVFRFFVAGFGGRIQAGIYDIPAGTRPWRIARMLARGEVASTTILIPEGLTVRQIVAILDANRFLTGMACAPSRLTPLGGESVQGAGGGASSESINAKNNTSDEIAPPRRALPDTRPQEGGDAHCPPEGALFPDTYKVSKGTPRAAVLDMMRKKMADTERGWTASGRRAPYPLRNWNDVVTLASIVQKETPKVSEMPLVASVYLNRLRKKMKLQADPTVVYAITDALGDMEGRPLLANHLKTESPYNTYVHYGMPPAPIANVGRDAIRAVLNPADTNYLFFVADGSGGHAFARDLAEHNANCAKWRVIKKELGSKK